jgi:hypothetical protein
MMSTQPKRLKMMRIWTKISLDLMNLMMIKRLPALITVSNYQRSLLALSDYFDYILER